MHKVYAREQLLPPWGLKSARTREAAKIAPQSPKRPRVDKLPTERLKRENRGVYGACNGLGLQKQLQTFVADTTTDYTLSAKRAAADATNKTH